MGGTPYLSAIVLIHALVLVLLPCCSYGGRINIRAASFSSSDPIPLYVISSRLEVVVPDRKVGGNGVVPPSPKRNPPIHYKRPPPAPRRPPPPPPPSPSPPPCPPVY